MVKWKNYRLWAQNNLDSPLESSTWGPFDLGKVPKTILIYPAHLVIVRKNERRDIHVQEGDC